MSIPTLWSYSSDHETISSGETWTIKKESLEFIVPDDYEDDLPTFLPSQLDQVCQQFMQSEVSMADQVAPLAPAENKEPPVSSSPQIVCEENQDSTGVPMTDGNLESQEMLQIPDSVEPDEDASSTLESPSQCPQHSRRLPNVLSYYGLGISQDSHPGIYSVSPQLILICTNCLHPLITKPPVYAPVTYLLQPYQNQGLPIWYYQGQ